MNASSEPLNMKVVWGDPDTAPYSVYQHITYLWEEPHQDGKCMVFPRSTDCIMSFNCRRKPHFVASRKSQPAVLLLAGLTWSSTNQLMTLLQGSAGLQVRAVREAGVGWLSSSTRCAMQSDPRRSEAEPQWTSTLEPLLASCLLTSH